MCLSTKRNGDGAMYTVGQQVVVSGFGTLDGKKFRGTVTRILKTTVEVTSGGVAFKFSLLDGRQPGTVYSGWKLRDHDTK